MMDWVVDSVEEMENTAVIVIRARERPFAPWTLADGDKTDDDQIPLPAIKVCN